MAYVESVDELQLQPDPQWNAELVTKIVIRFLNETMRGNVRLLRDLYLVNPRNLDVRPREMMTVRVRSSPYPDSPLESLQIRTCPVAATRTSNHFIDCRVRVRRRVLSPPRPHAIEIESRLHSPPVSGYFLFGSVVMPH